jgi:xylulokinase
MTGEWSLERNWALESGFWDARRHDWYAPAFAAVGTPEAWLPPVRAAHDVVGAVTPAAAAASGLRAGTPVIAGSADHVAAALAAGSGPGELVLKIGGGGDVLYGVDRFAPDPRLFIDYHDLPDRFLLNGCMVASGLLVKWFAELFARDLGPGEDRYARLDAEAAPTPPGADGLVVLPYFLGEKTPIFDAEARGMISGLTLGHGRGHLFRAMLEAVAYGFRHHVDVLMEGGHPIQSIRIMDRGARSALWRQIVADVLGRSIEYAPGADLGSAFGVAWVAGVALGAWGWRRPPEPAGAVHHAVPERTARYDSLYRRYRELGGVSTGGQR